MMSTALKFLHSIPLFNYFTWHKNFGVHGSVALPALSKHNNVRFDMVNKFPRLAITYRTIDPVLKSDAARVDKYALWKCFCDQVEYFDNN